MGSTKKEKVKKMGNIIAYRSEKEFPRDMKPGQLYVDKARNVVLLPINNGKFVPFHISTIKNVSTTTEGQSVYLRVNFHIPAG